MIEHIYGRGFRHVFPTLDRKTPATDALSHQRVKIHEITGIRRVTKTQKQIGQRNRGQKHQPSIRKIGSPHQLLIVHPRRGASTAELEYTATLLAGTSWFAQNAHASMGQAHQLIDVRKNGAFIFSDILLIDYRQQNLVQLLQEITAQRTHLEHMVKRYLRDDERMLGQEKANVANILHMIIRNLSALYLRIFDVEFANEFGDGLEVTEGKDGFLIKGKMDPKEVNIQFSVSEWVNNYLDNAMQALIKAFQEAARDHKITLQEKVILIADIRIILLQCVQAFYLIRTGAVYR
jgi:hypothetical protein